MSVKVTATFNGQTFIRRTVRHYTHAVIAKASKEKHLAWRLSEAEAYTRDSEWDHIVREANPATTQCPHMDSARRAEYARYVAQGREATRAERIAHARAIVAEQEAEGEFDTYQALTWCGRPDLALKEQAKALRDGWYTEAHIVEATYP